MLPPDDQLTLCFAHVAYRFAERYAQRGGRLQHFEVRSLDELEARIGEADVLLVSGMWRNHLAAKAPRLQFIQSISAGVDQYDRAVLGSAGIRLASAQGANANAVSEHAMALILAQARLLPQARDNQVRKHWRGMIGDLTQREDELGGKTLLVVGIGRIGGRLARLAKAFGMNVIGLRQDPAKGAEGADEIHGMEALMAQLPRADIVALTCALTPETRGLIGAAALGAMKPGASLVNVARGAVCDEAALVAALASGQLGQAALDVTAEEPLAESSPLWSLPNVLITPHTGGETRAYEGNVLDLLEANLPRLRAGQALVNQVV
ncbi:D-2-hydroxyacid dehydrogenase [Falsiroseomonas selenitidurans]|uniref:D-2-hydroxyacid dehydrogenase n=1 Tax=Falsiroseomonas selenitidurans TaxID=2716335 RepID=A0ABX1E7J0_9PROT|nr:D-2-hydroxyacid dehydrogenase [Falsiroseomonas selenitidurans]NKC31778.1 D-2-hydroxyacid dehydrogenase [Falsiroseomonas selenitidurans]